MGAIQGWWRTPSNFIIPAMMVVGLNSLELPEGLDPFNSADGMLLKGGSSELANTSSVATDLSTTTATVGNHTAGGTFLVGINGSYENQTSGSTSKYKSSGSYGAGAHGGHSVKLNYTPKQSKLKLVQARYDVKMPDSGIVMFSLANNGNQESLDLLNDHGGFLAGGETGIVDASGASDTTGLVSASHVHRKAGSDCSCITCTGRSPAGKNISTSNYNHAHAGASITTHSLVLPDIIMRAYHVIDKGSPEDLIGIWPSDAPIPKGWELVASANDRYVRFGNSGLGNTTDGSLITLDGVTGSAGHAHYASSTTGCPLASAGHSGTHNHNHAFSLSKAFEADRFFVRFVRKI